MKLKHDNLTGAIIGLGVFVALVVLLGAAPRSKAAQGRDLLGDAPYGL